MSKNLVFGPILTQILVPKFFVWVLLYVAHCCKLLLYAISTKTNEVKLRQWQKPRFWSNFGPFDPNLGCQFYFIFFPKNLAVSH